MGRGKTRPKVERVSDAVSNVITKAQEEQYQQNVFRDERPICGREGYKGRVCENTAGSGTDHLGLGPCVQHENKKERESRLLLAPVKNASTIVLRHQRLRELVDTERMRENLDSLDNEIVLLRAMIGLLSEKYGFVIGEDDEGNREEMPAVTFSQFDEQSRAIAKLIDSLSGTIRRKWEVLQLGGAIIPRETVRAYISQIQAILNQTLRNSCPKCGAVHNMRENALAALRLLGGL